MSYTVAEAAQRSGLTVHTLRYYDREGLLPFVERAPSGFRAFQDSDLEWLSLISCLKKTGMQIKDIRRFIDLCTQGDETLDQRLQLFRLQKERVEAQIAELLKYRKKIESKIHYYEVACAAKTEEAARHICCGEEPSSVK